MEWLNYHHLLYFWMVAKEGTVARASEVLRLAQPTLSGQIRSLEEALGEKLFVKKGRHLELTEVGRIVFAYADDIFRLGRELMGTVKGQPTGRPLRLRVGVSDVVPKLVAYRILEPAMRLSSEVQLVCEEDKADRLLAQLATHQLDLVIADQPVPPAARVRVFNHLLGESGVSFFAGPKVKASLSGRFPKCLDRQPMLVPMVGSQLRSALERYFDAHEVHPRVVAEFEDTALLKVFGERGEGIFAGATVIEKEIRKHYAVSIVGRASDLVERYYAITVERRLSHPAVIAICATARERLFAK